MKNSKSLINEDYAEHQCKILGGNFYKSSDWKNLRRRALKIYGAECHRCYSQGSMREPLHVDHIKPKSLYPRLSFDITNLQILCKKCNEVKSNLHETDYRPDRHKKFAEDYKNNISSLREIFLERTQGIASKRTEAKQLVKVKKPNNLKKISKAVRKKRKAQNKAETKLQVMFLQAARASISNDNFSTFLHTFIQRYGADTAKRLVKRCNLTHLLIR